MNSSQKVWKTIQGFELKMDTGEERPILLEILYNGNIEGGLIKKLYDALWYNYITEEIWSYGS